jgi:hypothetical protein
MIYVGDLGHWAPQRAAGTKNFSALNSARPTGIRPHHHHGDALALEVVEQPVIMTPAPNLGRRGFLCD